jgi:hypothetical protein
MGERQSNLVAAQRRAAVPEESNPQHWDAQGRLTPAGQRAMIAAGHSVLLPRGITVPGGGRTATQEDHLPTVSQYATAVGDPSLVERARQELLAQRRNLDLQLQQLDIAPAGTGPVAQPGTGIGGAQLPPNQPPTGAGTAEQTVTQVDRQPSADEGNLNRVGTGTPSPSTSGATTGAQASIGTTAEEQGIGFRPSYPGATEATGGASASATPEPGEEGTTGGGGGTSGSV